MTSIEADPAKFTVLQRNVLLNIYGQVTLVADGASDRNERLTLHHHPDNLRMHSFVYDFGKSDTVVQCPPLIHIT